MVSDELLFISTSTEGLLPAAASLMKTGINSARDDAACCPGEQVDTKTHDKWDDCGREIGLLHGETFEETQPDERKPGK